MTTNDKKKLEKYEWMFKTRPFIFQCLQFAKWYCDMCPNGKTCTFRVNK